MGTNGARSRMGTCRFRNGKAACTGFVRGVGEATGTFGTLKVGRKRAMAVYVPGTPRNISDFCTLGHVNTIPTVVRPLSTTNRVAFCLGSASDGTVLILSVFCRGIRRTMGSLNEPIGVVMTEVRSRLGFPLGVLCPLALGGGPPRLPSDRGIIH